MPKPCPHAWTDSRPEGVVCCDCDTIIRPRNPAPCGTCAHCAIVKVAPAARCLRWNTRTLTTHVMTYAIMDGPCWEGKDR